MGVTLWLVGAMVINHCWWHWRFLLQYQGYVRAKEVLTVDVTSRWVIILIIIVICRMCALVNLLQPGLLQISHVRWSATTLKPLMAEIESHWPSDYSAILCWETLDLPINADAKPSTQIPWSTQNPFPNITQDAQDFFFFSRRWELNIWWMECCLHNLPVHPHNSVNNPKLLMDWDDTFYCDSYFSSIAHLATFPEQLFCQKCNQRADGVSVDGASTLCCNKSISQKWLRHQSDFTLHRLSAGAGGVLISCKSLSKSSLQLLLQFAPCQKRKMIHSWHKKLIQNNHLDCLLKAGHSQCFRSVFQNKSHSLLDHF